MKSQHGIICLILIGGLMACNNVAEKTKHERGFDCNALADKKVIYRIAKSLIDKHDNEHIWNLAEIDTTVFFSTEDYFINTSTRNRLVLVGGSAGMSSGTADNLLILFSCLDTTTVVWAGQVGDFAPGDVRDLNGDGIKEIAISAGMMWMGECNDSYAICNFKGGKKNTLYAARSTSVLDCGRDNLGELFKPGDTLEQKIDYSLQKINDKTFGVKQIRTCKIHHGGQTDEEILASLSVIADTINVALKSF